MSGLWIRVRAENATDHRSISSWPRRCVMFARPRHPRLVAEPIRPVSFKELRS